ncbi:transmembrane ascorbate-dependent reductase CYB561-like [Saccoglossus kowalevskii]|uniref:Cytochrome b561-like n=1 Tax=Saccoglossus kowalevskii TaxID=10224 RepID=A0ABM0M1S5_SACKO|nr:PREDICTED: cytochrome b561-like [Saccoglossus kowalevskii]
MEKMIFFQVLVLCSQLVGLLGITLIGVWMGKYLGGFAWDGSDQQFNLHPLLMTVGLIFLYAEAMLVYRVFRNTTKIYIKCLHGMIHLLALICAVIGLKAVFDNHNFNGITNMYSLHSWIGITTVVLFSLQLLCGFVSFLVPGVSRTLRASYLPTHVFFGVFIFGMAVASALMGITEKLLFTLDNYSDLPAEARIANTAGICFLVFAGIIGYLVTRHDFKREEVDYEHEPLAMD